MTDRPSYPLAWPAHYARTAQPQHARFRTSPGHAFDEIRGELIRIKARDVVITTNNEVRRDGRP